MAKPRCYDASVKLTRKLMPVEGVFPGVLETSDACRHRAPSSRGSSALVAFSPVRAVHGCGSKGKGVGKPRKPAYFVSTPDESAVQASIQGQSQRNARRVEKKIRRISLASNRDRSKKISSASISPLSSQIP